MRRRYLTAEFLAQPWALAPEWMNALARAVQAEASEEAGPLIEKLAERYSAKRATAAAGGAIAVVPLHGVMTQRGNFWDELFGSGSVATSRVSALLSELAADPAVGAIVLDIDSPGGSVYGVAELGDLVYSLRGAKPTVAVANSMAASAAYWVASAADELVVAPGAEVGSIGVWTMHADISKALADAGVGVTLVSAGKYKTEGNPYGPLSQEARDYAQSQVDDYYGAFVKAVARNRKATQTAVRDGYGQGRTVIGEQAVKAGLADRVATLGQVIGELQAKLGGAKGARKASARELRERNDF